MIIAIDGPSGTGKSTVAKEVAKRLKFTFFDTGAMYRSFAWQVREKGIDPIDLEKVEAEILVFHFNLQTNEQGERSYFVGGKEVTKEIRSREISTLSSQIAAYQSVRNAMVKMQRNFGQSCDAVFEGRDMGTVVFPDADLKIFLTAKPSVRAERRYRELLAKFPDLSESINPKQILHEMIKRDESDTTREISPLKQAPDAILIDTSDSSIDEVVEKIIRLKPKGKKPIHSMKFMFLFVHSLARLFFKLFFRLKVYGERHVKPGAGLLIGNHTSFCDPPLLSVSCSEEVHFLAKESLFRVPLFGPFIRRLNAHPVSRSSTDMHILRQMIKFLSEDKKLIIFPEGRRSPNGQLQSFERGFLFLAQKAKCPIFPAYIDGTYEAWPIHKKFPRFFVKTTCVFGSPIVWKDFENLPKQEIEAALTKRCSEAILGLKDWLKQGAKGIPP